MFSQRACYAKTRNLRLTAIRSLFTYASLRHPEHAHTIARVLAIPPKRHHQRTITYLTAPEASALINAPDPARWEGRRDRTLLTLDMAVDDERAGFGVVSEFVSYARTLR